MSFISDDLLAKLGGITGMVNMASSEIEKKTTEFLEDQRVGIGTEFIDYAYIDPSTNLVTTTWTGYADTTKNPPPLHDWLEVGIGSTYRGSKNQCLVQAGWTYTTASGFYNGNLPAELADNWVGLRKVRDQKLLDSDWTQAIADSPLSSDKKTEWATYRQQLRDFPATLSSPQNPTWPTQPS